MSLIAGLDERDRQRRKEKAQQAAMVPMLLVRNRCVQALADLPDPLMALEVIRGIERSILEFMAIKSRQ